MDLAALAEQLRSGQIGIGQWEAAMRDYIRQEYTTAMILAKGGRENITQSDWGYMGSSIKKQYAYLNNFAKDIQKNPGKWMNGRLDVRMNLYKESAFTALEDYRRREAMQQGYDEERGIRHASESCPDCIDREAQGWQPIGSLLSIGDSQCITNCKCEFDFRKSGEA